MNPYLTIEVIHSPTASLSSLKVDCLALLIGPNDAILDALTESDSLRQALKQFGSGQKPVHLPLAPDAVAAQQLLLCQLGTSPNLPIQRHCLKALTQLAHAVVATRAPTVALSIPEKLPEGIEAQWLMQNMASALEQACYKYKQTLSAQQNPDNDADQTLALKQVSLIVSDDSLELSSQRAGASRGAGIGVGINMARELGNLPPNICTPAYLANTARQLAETYDCFELDLLNQQDLEQEKAGALLAVSQGSTQPPFLFRLKYRQGGSAAATCALVGKGVIFDTGGISLKPSANMADMKYDMSGAGAVLGVMRALAELRPPINVDGVVAAVENMPSGCATRPSDVVTSLSGKTVEILNTDAEGRLILCDALTWAARSNPDIMIDIATLTGACVVALGHTASGLYSNDDSLAHKLLAASDKSGDSAWRMPLWEEYNQLLKTSYADVANISSGGAAGSITAACFLQRFVGNRSWAHLDVAGTAHKGGTSRASTGRPVGLLLEFLLNHFYSQDGAVSN
ncbi:MAG: leucyl aminopeptidase [Gammaproteobacteria bacterium]